MNQRVLGIDPGLTRCGIGIVDVAATRAATLVHVSVIRTPPDLPLEQRLLAIAMGIEPHSTSSSRSPSASSECSRSTTSAPSWARRRRAASRCSSRQHAGSRSACTRRARSRRRSPGYGAADKRQVGAMVARVLGLADVPKPADAADALAIAICHAWKGVANRPAAGVLTPAQRAWRAAESAAARVR